VHDTTVLGIKLKGSRRYLLNDVAELLKITKIRTTPLFFQVDLCLATSMESSRRDLLNDMADHTRILKNNQNMYKPVLVSLPKQV